MPQRSEYDSLFPVTVMDVVLMGRLGRGGISGWLGWYGRKDRAAAREALEQVHMADAGQAELRGPFRRPAAAGAHRTGPLLPAGTVALDEPTANVDSLVEERLFDELRQLAGRMTIVLVSHDLGFVTSLVQRVICVNRQAVAHPAAAYGRRDPRDVRRRRERGPAQRRRVPPGARA